jgi:hypothetical protein
MRIVRGWAQPEQGFGTSLWLFETSFRDAEAAASELRRGFSSPESPQMPESAGCWARSVLDQTI